MNIIREIVCLLLDVQGSVSVRLDIGASLTFGPDPARALPVAFGIEDLIAVLDLIRAVLEFVRVLVTYGIGGF